VREASHVARCSKPQPAAAATTTTRAGGLRSSERSRQRVTNVCSNRHQEFFWHPATSGEQLSFLNTDEQGR
jgi:hypothetical protein